MGGQSKETRTTDSVLESLKLAVENKVQFNPNIWIEGAQMLSILMGDEQDALFELQQKVAEAKVQYITDGDSVAFAKVKVEATDEYKKMQQQKAKCERIEEMIRVAKIRARLSGGM